jgi:hypothetical protein
MDGVRVIDLGGRQFLAAGDTMVPIDSIRWIGFGARWDDESPDEDVKVLEPTQETEVLICHGEDCMDSFSGPSAEAFARWAGYVRSEDV